VKVVHDVDHEGRRAESPFRHRWLHQASEGGQQGQRQIVDAEITEIFKRIRR